MFEVDYSLVAPEFGTVTVEALDADEAEQKAMFKLEHERPEASEIFIELVKEVK